MKHELDVDDFNLLSTSTFSHGHPQEAYDRIRATSPVLRHAGSAVQPDFWVLTRYDDIHSVSMDGERFSSAKGFRLQTDNRASMDPEIGRILSRFLIAMDPPEHTPFRRLIQPAFLPNALAEKRPRIQASVDALIGSLEPGMNVEFVRQVAAVVPIKTICAILGVPAEDESKVMDWTNGIFGTDDPDYAITLEEANQKYLAVFDYAIWLVRKKREQPEDDLMSVLAHAEINGEPLDDDTLKSYFSNTLAAGNETTRSSLAGAVWTLYNHQAQLKRLIDDPELIPNAINELLRHFSPVYQMMRTARTKVEIGGQMISEGERVVMLYGAANHDPDMFEAPHEVSVTRDNAQKHLAFGVGIHHCAGSRLGRMQLQMLLAAFLQRFPGYRVTGEPTFLASNFVQAMKSLHVRL
ncbi:MAG: cytochrome P450 [Gammaproteobacteria bacterium]|nr:cytochrome P450 [Gammaproteobacteria bacterium]